VVKPPTVDYDRGWGYIVIEGSDGQDYEYDVPGHWSLEKSTDYAFSLFEQEHPKLTVVASNDHWFL
jgi:hypothetical protein